MASPAPPRRPSYFSLHFLMVAVSSLITISTHLIMGSCLHLLFHCGFKSEVRCEEARACTREEGEQDGVQQRWAGRRRRGVKAKRRQGCRV